MPASLPGIVLVTGASGFIGGAVAERLVNRRTVRSLTTHPAKNRFGNRVVSLQAFCSTTLCSPGQRQKG